MPDIDDLQRVSEETDDFLQDMQRLHRRRLRSSIKKMEDRITALMKELETTKTGRLESVKVNLKQIQKNQRDMLKIFKSEYGVALEDVIEDYDEISEFIRRSWRNLDEVVRFTGIDKTMINALKEQTFTQLEGLGDVARNRIAGAMYDTVIAQQPFNVLVNRVKGALRGHVDVRGVPMEVHANTTAFDGVMNFHNQVNLKKAEDLGLRHFLYVGNVIATTRRFCQVRAGNTYTRGQIDSWNRLQWTGKSGPPFTHRGGYNCRHHWRPVRPEWVPEGGVDVQRWDLAEGEGT